MWRIIMGDGFENITVRIRPDFVAGYQTKHPLTYTIRGKELQDGTILWKHPFGDRILVPMSTGVYYAIRNKEA